MSTERDKLDVIRLLTIGVVGCILTLVVAWGAEGMYQLSLERNHEVKDLATRNRTLEELRKQQRAALESGGAAPIKEAMAAVVKEVGKGN